MDELSPLHTKSVASQYLKSYVEVVHVELVAQLTVAFVQVLNVG